MTETSVEMAAAKMPAMTRPEIPGGRCWRMKTGKMRSGFSATS